MSEQVKSAEKIKKLMFPLIEKGFSFAYTYEKGGDSSCVYICRFSKGKDFFDWRETSGTWELHFVVYANGEYRFPSVKGLNPKASRAFAIKHLFKKATVDEIRAFSASVLLEYLQNSPEFFGIKL